MVYKGHKVNISNGYYDVYFPEHPNARKNGSVMMQVLVAEEILGRVLEKEEVVHHKDFNRLNNDKNNLMIFASNYDHMNYHSMLKENIKDDYILYRKDGVYKCELLYVFLNKKNIKFQKHKKLKPCPKCGNMIDIKSNLCYKCNGEKARKTERPSKNILKEDIKNLSFVNIGKKYGVSDNTIRKWCKQYSLPNKSSEIKKLSEEEWILL